MSPEQARGEELDARTDIFSSGLVLYELLTGQRPYGDLPDDEMLRQLTGDEEIQPVSQRLPKLPAALDRIVTRALRKNRDERYPTASEMLHDLKELRVNQAETGLQRLRRNSANQMLTQFAVRYDEDKTTRIPLGGLWTIGRFADLPRGELEREVLRKSRWSVFRRLGGLALVIAAVTMLIAAAASVTETWEERLLRDGHTAAVRRAVFSPDGTKLVSVGEDKQVIVWDFEKRERLATFNDHTDWVAAVAFSPDGKWFATASYDKTVIVWDAIKLQKETVLHGHRGKVVSVAFSPDGQVLASADAAVQSEDRATLLWRVGSWGKFAQIPLGYSEANSLLFTAGGRRLIYHLDTSDEHLPNTWDVATGQPLDNEFDPAWTSNNAALSLDGTLLVSVNPYGEVIFVDFNRRRLLDRFKAHQDNGRAVALSPDGLLAATGSENIILWDVATRRKITTIDYPSIVWSAAFSPDGRWLISTHGDGGIRVWDVQERQRAIGFNEHNGPVRAVAWSRDGQRFASAGEDRSVMIWNAESGRREMLLSGHPTRVVGVAFAPDNHTLASVDRDGLVIVWDMAQRRERLRFGHPVVKDGNCLAISPDGRVIATSHGAYESTTGRRLADFNSGNDWLSSSAIYGLAFTADGARLAAANAYGRSVVLDTATWSLIEKADFSPRQFISVSFAPDGKQLVTGEDGGTVQLWTAQPLRPTIVLGQHDARIKSVAFSPDGTEVVSAGDDKTIALWEVAGRRRIANIGLHTSPVYAVAWSPDGRQIISGAHDHSVRLYTRRRSLWGWSLD
jgi:WD40 repeat protein